MSNFHLVAGLLIRLHHKYYALCAHHKCVFRVASLCNSFKLVMSSAVVDTTFVDIYVDTKNIPTCRYNIQHIDKRTMEK